MTRRSLAHPGHASRGTMPHGALTDQGGFPLMVSAFEGNKAVWGSKTMLPVLTWASRRRSHTL